MISTSAQTQRMDACLHVRSFPSDSFVWASCGVPRMRESIRNSSQFFATHCKILMNLNVR